MSYIESPDGGTRHVYFGGKIPDGWKIVEGAIPGPAPAPDPLKELTAKVAALEKDVADIKAAKP